MMKALKVYRKGALVLNELTFTLMVHRGGRVRVAIRNVVPRDTAFMSAIAGLRASRAVGSTRPAAR